MDKIEIIKVEINELIKKLINKFEVKVEQKEEVFHIIIKTEEAATIIGKHGETIRALQKILEVIFYKKFGESVNILVNVNDYREKQRERLEKIAKSVAQKVLQDGRERQLPSFSSFERKIIHEYIAKNYPKLTSSSIGEGKNRRLTVGLKISN